MGEAAGGTDFSDLILCARAMLGLALGGGGGGGCGLGAAECLNVGGPLEQAPKLKTLGDLGGGEGLRDAGTPSVDVRLFVVRNGGGRLPRTPLALLPLALS